MARTFRVLVCCWLLLTLLVAGCSWTTREPGLFERRTEPPTPTPTNPVNPELPVVGEAVWSAGDTVDATIRIAVHGVRRTGGATVLDWSLTPLTSPGLAPGSPLPAHLDLGLDRPGSDAPRITLVDPVRRQVLRPLVSTPAGLCVCTPTGTAAEQLRLGRTMLLQVAFPALAPEVRVVDVDISTVPVFASVPVAADGAVPLAINPPDLARPATRTPPYGRTPVLTDPASGQQLDITVDGVWAAATATSLAWTIHSVTAGPGLAGWAHPLFADPRSPGSDPSAGGPTLTPVGSTAAALRSRRVGRPPGCQCTDLARPYGPLRLADRHLGAITTFGPLPRGTVAVDVDFPGAGRLTRVPVTTSSDGTFRSAGPARRTVGTYREPPVAGWSVEEWPTPLPEPALTGAATATVEELRR